MKFSSDTDSQHEFQIAPMIDIVFLLLVFFIATYSMAQIERELNVELPESEAAEAPISRINDLVVNIAADGDIVVNRHPMEAENLLDRLRRLASFGSTPNVIIRADAACPHKHVIRVMDICAKADVRSIFFSTQPKEPDHDAAP